MRRFGDAATVASALNAITATLQAPQTARANAETQAQEDSDKSVSVKVPWVPIMLTFVGIIGLFVLMRKK